MTDDPYCWPGSDCLENKLGIHDKARLVLAEARLVSARDVLVARFLRQLSAAAGWYVDWSGLDPAQNAEASAINLATGDIGPLVDMLNPVVSQH